MTVSEVTTVQQFYLECEVLYIFERMKEEEPIEDHRIREEQSIET